jgi:hypothetical protein
MNGFNSHTFLPYEVKHWLRLEKYNLMMERMLDNLKYDIADDIENNLIKNLKKQLKYDIIKINGKDTDA